MIVLKPASLRIRTFLALALVCASGSLYAADPQTPAVRVEVEPEVVRVGEPITLRVSVFAPTWFPQPPVFPNFELPNTLTRLPANSSGPISERVGRATWSGIQRRYQIFPLIAGQFQISDRQLTVTYADPQSRQPIEVDLALPVINFSSEVPAGAESLDPYIAGERFELRRVVSGDSVGLSAGDAIELTYRASLEGLPAMFLPDLFTDPEIPGLSVYAQEPLIKDEDGRAVREETLTLVFDGGGEFTLPAVELGWWDTRLNELATARIDELTISVSGPGVSTSMVSGATRDWRAVIVVILLVAGALTLLWVLLRKRVLTWVDRARQARALHRNSEAYAFKMVCQSLRNKDQRECFQQLLSWIERLEPGLDLEAFCQKVGDEALADQLDVLRRRLFTGAGETLDFEALARHLKRARTAFLEAQVALKRSPLPLLNPR